jgi:antitoxin component YwqK of YwqJK toxin-antitoxin module
MQMKYILRGILVLTMTLTLGQLRSQDTAHIQGKVYWVFNQKLSRFNVPFFSFSGVTINHDLPPIIGNYQDGEYVLMHEFNKAIYKRNKFVERITILKPYATFSIKNNKKNGVAIFYNWDGTVYTHMEFEDDQLNSEVILRDERSLNPLYGFNASVFAPRYDAGSAVLQINRDLNLGYIEGGYFNDLVSFSYNWRKRLRFNKKFSQILTMNFKKGLLHGELHLKFIYKSDTFSYTKAKYVEGELQGEFEHCFYNFDKKKVVPKWTLNGWNNKNMKDSIWRLVDMKGVIEGWHQFKNGKCVYYKNAMKDYTIAFGRDSVLKYENDTINRIFYPNFLSRRDKNYAVINYKKNGIPQQAFIYREKSDLNYFKDILGVEIKDTIFNGKRYRFEISKNYNGGKTHSLMLINDVKTENKLDVLSDDYQFRSNVSDFTTTVYDSIFDFKGNFLYDLQYLPNPFENSYKLVSKWSITKKKNLFFKFYEEEEVYFSVNNKRYSNFTFLSKRNSLKKISHRLIGDSITGALIRVFNFDIKGDNLQIVDTIWKANKDMAEKDEYLEYMKEGYFENSYHHLDLYLIYIRKIYQLDLQKHCRVDLNGIPYDAVLRFNINYGNSKANSRGKYLKYRNKNKYKDPNIIIDLHFSKKCLKYQYWMQKVVLPEKNVVFKVNQGNPSGFYIYDIHNYNSTNQKFDYNNNQLDGKVYLRFVSLDSRACYFCKTKLKAKRIKLINYIELPYVNGLKQGQWRMENLMALNFEKNQLNGLQVLGNSDNIDFFLNYQNDSLHGKFLKIQETGHPLIEGDYEHGLPNGQFKIYFNDLDSGSFVHKTMEFKNGYFDGQYKEYTENGELMYVAQLNINDSMGLTPYGSKNIRLIRKYLRSNFSEQKLIGRNKYFRKSDKDSLQFEKELGFFLNIQFIEFFKKADYTYYYKSGSMFKKGQMNYNQPEGNWKFYAENNNYLFKDIQFKDSSIHLFDNDTLKTYGLVKTYYENGQLMSLGLATDKQFAYNCSSGSDMPTENDHYLEFYDSFGNALLVNDSGYIRELQVNGLVLKEGRIENNLKQGLWIYYSSYGLPTDIGAYKNGKKEGRWLSGDLGSINLKDDMCFMSDTDFRIWIETQGKNLKLEEIYYKDGKVISRKYFYIRTN